MSFVRIMESSASQEADLQVSSREARDCCTSRGFEAQLLCSSHCDNRLDMRPGYAREAAEAREALARGKHLSTVNDAMAGEHCRLVHRRAPIARKYLLRILSTTTVHGATRVEQGSAEILDEDCNVLALAPAGTNVLVSCFTFGRLDNNSFTPLPGFSSGSSSGIGGQDTAAW
jgi:hypothetical protein